MSHLRKRISLSMKENKDVTGKAAGASATKRPAK
jgi:hypothetical protein